jgi:hypothetical protein
MTHKQYMAWLAWLADQWNQPSRSDAYAMQVAAEVYRGNAKKPREVQAKQFVLKFGTGRRLVGEPSSDGQPARDAETATSISQGVWFGITGYQGEIPEGAARPLEESTPISSSEPVDVPPAKVSSTSSPGSPFPVGTKPPTLGG